MKSILLVVLLLASAPASPARILSRGSPDGHHIALTFDAGADRGYAGSILKTLERFHVHASFGMTGLWARHNPDLVRRMGRDGDVIFNHTYDHRSFTGFSVHGAPLSQAQRTWEITQTERVVHSITGHSTKPFFRPPFGDYDAATLTLARTLGYHVMVMWTVDSLGWEGLSASAILHRCLALVHPGDILLMHVGIQSQDDVALPQLIRSLNQRGYRMVTVRQLAAAP